MVLNSFDFLMEIIFAFLVNRIKMDFTATRIATDDFTPDQVKAILADARQLIEAEEPTPNSKIMRFLSV